MRKILGVYIAAIFLGCTLIMSCDSSKENVEDAKEQVTEANKDLDEANKTYLADVEAYRVATSERIAANKKLLEDMKVSAGNDKAKLKADYAMRISELEKKNDEMRVKLEEYKATEKDKWEEFKTEFNHDMDGLGDAFKDLTVKNAK